jgi:anti-sigma factor RsiW
MSNHIAGEILAAFVDGTLPGKTRQGVESHLSRCPECRRDLADIVEIQNSRVQIPAEFLENALKVLAEGTLKAVPPRSDGVPDEGSVEPIGIPARRALPLRLAFGVAAVLLVALAVGYLFIGRERAGLPEILQKRILESTVAAEQKHPPAPAGPTVTARGAADAARPQAPAEALHGLEAGKKLASGEPAPGVTPAASPVKSAAPTDAAMKQERLREADETGTMPLREQEEDFVGGIIGGVEAPPEKDRLAAAKLAAPAPDRDKGSLPRKAEAQFPRFSGSGTAADAMQLFLAASGRASAPRLLQVEASSLRLPVEIRGDVTEEDLIEPWSLASWTWLPAGSRLQVTIAADGSVNTVELLGRWETGAAAQARTAAGKLVFSVSAQKVRRAVLSREPLN